ncbi:MAG TPA: HD domain-containing protein [Candidatus Mailhella excrementigallinarum]|nr:MAG: polynucleotide adenylyltransferase [Desulfovibrionaceae bacterium]HIV66527.1 HD domain-containing protein [Candidatus Mailhella excrementigallinarum]
MASLFLAGGAVRDMLLGRPVHDMDFAFSGTEEDFVQRFPHARKTSEHPPIWVAGGFEFCPLTGGSPDEDVMRRDLTVNALLLDDRGRLYMHPRSLDDLREGVLRPVSTCAFFDDPARVYRLARLAAALPDFSLAEEAVEQMRETAAHGLLESLPPERVCGETLKALAAPRPSRFLSALERGGCLRPWFAELAGCSDIPAGPRPWHDNSVLEHTGEIMDSIARNSGLPAGKRELAVWMGLCHDLGKAETDAAMLPHHYGHELRGELAARTLGGRLALPKRFIRAGAMAARLHMKAGMLEKLRPATLRDTLWEVHTMRLHEEFWALASADSGRRLQAEADAALDCILRVRLPEEKRGQGEASGRYLRELQCQTLAQARRAEGEQT